MNQRRLSSLWLLAGVLVVLATSVHSVSGETDSETGGFFAHLWDSIFGTKQPTTGNSTSAKNETDSAFSYNATTSTTSTTTPVSSTVVSAENGKNVTTTLSSSTSSSLLVTSETTTDNGSLKGKMELSGSVSTSTVKPQSTEATTTEINGVTTGAATVPTVNSTTEANQSTTTSNGSNATEEATSATTTTTTSSTSTQSTVKKA